MLASSAAVYGHPQSIPITEADANEPTSPYGLDKLASDHYARLDHDLYGLETVALRYFNVYGPGQVAGDYSGVISVFIDQALSGEEITIHGDGEQTREFVYVDDVVQANVKAATTDAVGEAYNIGTGESVTIRELAELIQDITDTDADIVHTEARPGDIDHSEADISKVNRQCRCGRASNELSTGTSTNTPSGSEQRVPKSIFLRQEPRRL
ncbi:NAD-dependent epimerase/dehydratase family protein [Natrialbaceae archaeon GCM10025810]|uniref:NAD-dependent epimerase/dehydratase family protein n=1 Tax=Halovalidus salilacus TaxID=3075124 RepID=UPI003616F4CB